MALPTVNVTPGIGQTINTLNSGQQLMSDSAAVVIADDQGPVAVAGNTSQVVVAPTVTAASAYANGNELGGLMTFAVGGQGGGANGAAAGGGIIESVSINCKSVQTGGLKLYLFRANPTSSIWTNKVNPAINVLDFDKVIANLVFPGPDNGLGTHTNWTLSGIGIAFTGANIFAILVTTSTPTFTASTDLSITIGIVNNS